MPPYEVLTIVRSMGFDPMSRPVLRGPVYVVRALDDDDIPVRVAIDARSGQVVRVTESGPNDPGAWQGGPIGRLRPAAGNGSARGAPICRRVNWTAGAASA